MALILSIETSTDICGAALLKQEALVSEAVVNRPRMHAKQLTSLIADVTEKGGAALSDLDAVAVSSGPGSYTGLRIGVSTAKGLAYVDDLPLVAVPSLEVIAAEAASCGQLGDHICAVRTARKDEVYCALYRIGVDTPHTAGLETVLAPRVAVIDDLPALLDVEAPGRLWLLGTGADRTAEVLDGPGQQFSGGRPAPTAYWVGRSAIHRYNRGEFADLRGFEPEYLRRFHTNQRKPLFERLPGNP